MATYNEIIYNLKNTIYGGITSDDVDISDNQLIWLFNQYRAKLVREDINKNSTIDPQIIQDLGCVRVECVDAAGCCDIEGVTTVTRTTQPIPKTIESYLKNHLTFVGTADKVKSYQITTEAQARWSIYNKYTKNLTKAYLRDNDRYLYILNAPKGIEVINIQGVFENPEDAESFTTCSNEPCFSRDKEYPVSAHMITIINSLMYSTDLKLMLALRSENLNNSQDDKPGGTTPQP